MGKSGLRGSKIASSSRFEVKFYVHRYKKTESAETQDPRRFPKNPASSRRQRTDVHEIRGVFLDFFVGGMERGAGECHEACAGGFQDAEVGDEF